MSKVNEETEIDPTSPEETIDEEELDPTLEEKDQVDEEEEEIDEEEQVEDSEEGEEEETPVDPKTTTPTPEAPDYRKKFSESTRRNQIVESQFRELQKVLGDITKQEVPTDDEMRVTDADWEYRSDYEKMMAKKSVVLERRQNLILASINNIATESEFARSIDEFISTKPELKNKEEAFFEFASKPANRGASPDVLLSAFLFEVKDVTPEQDQSPKPKAEKRPQLARGTGRGGNESPKKKEGTYSDEEIKLLRTKDPKKYFDLIRKGKI